MTEQWLTKECAELLSNMMTGAEVKEAIKSAVLAEREAIAKLVENASSYQSWQVAAVIRARGETK